MNVPWRPKVDQATKEQAALFTTACAGPSRTQRSAPSYAHRLWANAGASTGVCIVCEDVVVDAILCAVHSLREVRDVKVAARRLNDLPERREVSAPASDPRGQDRLHRWVPADSRIHLGEIVWNHLHT